MAEVLNDTTSALDVVNICLNSLTRVVMDSLVALDFLLASHGGICAIANTSCPWIHETDKGLLIALAFFIVVVMVVCLSRVLNASVQLNCYWMITGMIQQ